MEIENTQNNEAPATAGSTEVAAPAATPEAPASVEAGQGGAVVPPPYQPNLTFKVRHEQKKFDDWLIPHIKDAETEKKARELHERAYGIDFVKQERGSLQQQVQAFKQKERNEYQPLVEARDQIQHFSQPGQENIPAICQILGLNPQAVFKWAYEYASADAQKRQALDQQAQQGIQQYGTQRHAMTAEQIAVQQAADFKMREYQLLSQYNPQVQSAIAEVDAAHGQGAFLEQMKIYGDYVFRTTGQDISVEDAANYVMKLIGRGQQASPQQPGVQAQPGQAPAAPQPNMVSTPTAPTPKPVIPGIQGKGTSPAKKVITSFAQARQLANELRQSE